MYSIFCLHSPVSFFNGLGVAGVDGGNVDTRSRSTGEGKVDGKGRVSWLHRGLCLGWECLWAKAWRSFIGRKGDVRLTLQNLGTFPILCMALARARGSRYVWALFFLRDGMNVGR